MEVKRVGWGRGCGCGGAGGSVMVCPSLYVDDGVLLLWSGLGGAGEVMLVW